MDDVILPVPQLGRTAVLQEDEQYLLKRRNKLDRSDPFVTDADAALQQMGKIVLRRQTADDYAALADRCAVLSADGHHLHLNYVQKT